MRKLRIFTASEPEIEWTIAADNLKIEKGILHTWCQSSAGRQYDHQYFVIVNLSRWAWA